MHVEIIPNRGSRPTVLLRESFREDGKVKKRTLSNLTDWPAEQVEALRRLLRGEIQPTVPFDRSSVQILRSRPYGHVAAILKVMRDLGVDKLLDATDSKNRRLVMAMVVARVIDPMSKLATARGLSDETLSSAISESLGFGPHVKVKELYRALDWLLVRQPDIELRLSARHLSDESFVLYDLTSTYFEGVGPSMARHGYSRDGKKGKVQVNFGIICDRVGRPIALEVFAGNTADPKTVESQVQKLKTDFGLSNVVFVGDRGMLTNKRIGQDIAPAEFRWITALRAPAIKRLIEEKHLQLSLFDDKKLAEIEMPDHPGERLIICRNQRLERLRARKRDTLLTLTEGQMEKIAQATQRARRPLRGKAEIGLRVGRVLNRYKMGKHFKIKISDTRLTYSRREGKILEEKALDGIYVVRTNVSKDVLSSDQTVEAYKSLTQVERAFRSIKTVDLNVRPVFHYTDSRVKAHIFLCMLAYYVEWEVRKRLRCALFDEEDPTNANKRETVVDPATPSPTTEKKVVSKRTSEDRPVHSFRTLIADLATITKNTVKYGDLPSFEMTSTATGHQKWILSMLGITNL